MGPLDPLDESDDDREQPRRLWHLRRHLMAGGNSVRLRLLGCLTLGTMTAILLFMSLVSVWSMAGSIEFELHMNPNEVRVARTARPGGGGFIWSEFLMDTTEDNVPIPKRIHFISAGVPMEQLPQEVQANVRRILRMNPDFKVLWWDDEACKRLVHGYATELAKEGSAFPGQTKAYCKEMERLADHYDREPRVSNRIEICRAAALLLAGGFFIDLQTALRQPLDEFVDASTSFVSVSNVVHSDVGIVVGVRKRSPIMNEVLRNISSMKEAVGDVLGIPFGAVLITILAKWIFTTQRTTLEAHSKELQWTCGEETIRLYQEQRLPCDGWRSWMRGIITQETTCARCRKKGFDGKKYGYYDPTTLLLMGWTRFEECETWDCSCGAARVDPGRTREELRIPRQIIMVGKEDSIDEMEPEVRKNAEQIMRMGTGFTQRYVGDRECAEILREKFPEFYKFFRNETKGSYRGDICRAAVLYLEGGFYIDLDFQPIYSLASYVDSRTTFMASYATYQAKANLPEDFPLRNATMLNAFMAATPQSKIMLATLEAIRRWYRGNITQSQGPFDPYMMGPATLMIGVLNVTDSTCGYRAMEQHRHISQWACGDQELRLYQERRIFCGGDTGKVSREDECSKPRKKKFLLQFGIASVVSDKLVAWCRFEKCDNWGCGTEHAAPTANPRKTSDLMRLR